MSNKIQSSNNKEKESANIGFFDIDLNFELCI